MEEKDILAKLKFHEEEILKLKQLLPKSREVINTQNLNKNDLIKLQARKIDGKFKAKKEVEDNSHIFFNKRVVITGEFPSFNNRNELAEMLQNVGADVNSTISSKTDYVIVGQKAGPKKLELIEKYQIKTINEHEFIKLF